QLAESIPDQLSQPPLDPVSLDRAANRLGYDETGAHIVARRLRVVFVFRKLHVDHEHAPGGPAAGSYRRGELTAAPQALRGGQHGCSNDLRPRARGGPWRAGPR